MVAQRHRLIGEKIVALRESKGWSQETLANKAGTSVKTISRLENGGNEGRGGTMQKLAEALGVDLAELLAAGAVPTDDAFAPLSQIVRGEAKLVALLGRLGFGPLAEEPLADLETEINADGAPRGTRRGNTGCVSRARLAEVRKLRARE
jgi:transcriptional regulator with XRE-family HTH domain